MKTVHEFTLLVVDKQAIRMPSNAQLLSVQVQRDRVCLWAVVDTKRPETTNWFIIVGTGHEIPAAERIIGYCGTVQLEEGALVFHVFQVE